MPDATHRVAWLHGVKTGTSFANTLAHYAAPTLPDRAALQGCRIPGFACEQALYNRHEAELGGKVWLKSDRRATANWGSHKPITTSAWQKWNGSFFGMFREPAEQLESMYAFFAPSFLRHAISGEMPNATADGSGRRGRRCNRLTRGWPAASCKALAHGRVQ